MPFSRRLQAGVAEILRIDWDPIGIQDEPAAQDEYDSYVSAVVKLLNAEATVDEIARHLVRIESDVMALKPNAARALSAAGKLVALK